MVLDFYNKPKTYYQGYESFCYQNCLRLILEANNVPCAPLYINSALSLIIDFESEEYKYNFKSHPNSRNFITGFSDKVKRHYFDLKDDCNEIFVANIEQIRKQSAPIVVGVDVFYLPYTPFYQKNHAIHTLVLCGYLESEDLVYVTDWYAPWFFNGTIARKDFLLARDSESPDDGSIYSGSSILNNWAEVEKDGWSKSPKELLTMTLKLSLVQYFEPSNDELVGVYAMQALSESIFKLNESAYADKLQVFKYLHKQLFTAMKRHKLFEQYLEIANDFVAIDNINSIVSSLSNIIEEWDTILMLVLKASMIDSVKSRNKLINSIDIVIEKEKILGCEIAKLYKILSGEKDD